jgi:hypothetical protein
MYVCRVRFSIPYIHELAGKHEVGGGGERGVTPPRAPFSSLMVIFSTVTYPHSHSPPHGAAQGTLLDWKNVCPRFSWETWF